MRRNLIRYLPDILKRNLDFRILMEVQEKYGLQPVWEAAQAVLDDQFITTSDEYGIARFEGILGLKPDEDDTLEDRRQAVLMAWRRNPHIGLPELQATADIWAPGWTELEYVHPLMLLVWMTENAPYGFVKHKAMWRELRNLAPANVAFDFAWRYLLVKEVHRQMSVAELEQTPKKYFAGYRARLLPGSPREYRKASGPVVSILSPQAWPLQGCTVEIRPAQEGSGEPSPENVRPIRGWTGAQIHVSPTTSADDGRTVAVDWTDEAGTVYGGMLDMTTGVLTVTYVYYENAGTGNWGETTTGGSRYYIGGVTMDALDSDTSGVCNIGKLVHDYYADGVQISRNGRISLCGSLHSFFSTLEDVKAYFAVNPLQVVYKLATPITYQLTPQEVTALAGQNNIWANCGDIAVEYASGESADYALSGTDRFRGSGILRFGPCLVVRERSKITVRRTGDRLDISDSPTYRYEAPEYEQIGDGLWSVDGALTVAADSMVSARKDGDTLMITGKEG